MKRIFLLTHSTEITGSVDHYERYLKKNGSTVTRLEHPLNTYAGRFSFFTSQGTTKKIKRFALFGIFNWFIDFFISLWFVFKTDFDVFIGANNFDTLVGVCAQKILRKKIKKVIFFATDFSQERFRSKILNKIYTLIESIVCRHSDLVISNTVRAERKRFEFGLTSQRSLVIPNGALIENKFFSSKELDTGSFLFIGSVTKEHGLFDLLQTLHPYIRRLVLIGCGDDWDRVLGWCQEKQIPTEVYYKKDHDFVIQFMKSFSGFGLAPYNLHSQWTYYCSPLKVAEYIACGLPVVMSSVPEIATLVKEKQLGVVYNHIDSAHISEQLKNFDTTNFHLKAKDFFTLHNEDTLYSKIPL